MFNYRNSLASKLPPIVASKAIFITLQLRFWSCKKVDVFLLETPWISFQGWGRGSLGCARE